MRAGLNKLETSEIRDPFNPFSFLTEALHTVRVRADYLSDLTQQCPPADCNWSNACYRGVWLLQC